MTMTPPLTRKGLSALLRLMELFEPTTTGSALYTSDPDCADELIDNGWLYPIRILPAVKVNNNEWVNVYWNERTHCHQYYLPGLGERTIASALVKRYRLHYENCLRFVMHLFDIKSPAWQVKLQADRLCHLGATNLSGENVDVFICGRLNHVGTFTRINSALREKVQSQKAIVVTARPGARALDLPEHFTEVHFESLLKRDTDYSEIDRDRMAKLANIVPAKRYSQEAHFSVDFRGVKWNGETHSFSKTQAAVMEALYLAGGRAHKDFLCAQASSDEPLNKIMRNRINDKWKKHPMWESLVKHDNKGFYFFCDDTAIVVPPLRISETA